MYLSVLDQSFVRGKDTPGDALHQTIAMAKTCEALGFNRFWVSEHHDNPHLAGSSPEVLLSAIGANTSSIRLGSGGIMLPHYSAYKVAENFSLLANLYPGRVDLGVGRAPGADMATAVALATDGRPKFERFPALVEQVSQYLWNPEQQSPKVSPAPNEAIPIWMLGTSPDSAVLAAQRGLPYGVALFINPQIDPNIIRYYKERFQPSDLQPQPHAMITISVLCAETEEQAAILKKTSDVNILAHYKGGHKVVFSTQEEAQTVEFTDEEKAFSRHLDTLRAVGTPEQVKEQIHAIAERFDADEVMAVSNCFYFKDRLTSFQLLAEVLEL